MVSSAFLTFTFPSSFRASRIWDNRGTSLPISSTNDWYIIYWFRTTIVSLYFKLFSRKAREQPRAVQITLQPIIFPPRYRRRTVKKSKSRRKKNRFVTFLFHTLKTMPKPFHRIQLDKFKSLQSLSEGVLRVIISSVCHCIIYVGWCV